MALRNPISKTQEGLLVRALREPENALRCLVLMVRGFPDEPLSHEWAHIWEERRQEARKECSPDVFARIESAIGDISSMEPFSIDPQISRLQLGEETDVCLLLGAGISAPEPSRIPTVTDLLAELWQRASRIGRDDIDRLRDWCENRGVRNIEDLLTAAYIANFSARNSNIWGLLDYFLFKAGQPTLTESASLLTEPHARQVDTASIALLQDTLQTLFGLLAGTMIPAAPNDAHEAVVSFVRRHTRSSIVTTNYDGCVDEALLKAKLRLNTYIEEEARPDRTDLIKVHGSINWSYCDSCHDVREFDLLNLKKAYDEDSLSYAVIGICRKCQGQRRPLLIPPMAVKFVMFPNLIRLWEQARLRIETSSLIIVVGFSFAEGDAYLNKIVERSMGISRDQTIVVCDRNRALADALRRRYAARIDRFDEARILAATGSAEKVLPQVLSRLQEARQSNSAPTASGKRTRRSAKKRSAK
ncbi:MAG TPA: SIR2 family protein [Thermoguttaceae bacterium]|nr:SIR2 family protein [Thermoguttaceae bacterium]